PSIELPIDAITGRPRIRLSVLSDGRALAQFLEVFDWVIDEIRAT
ncbi:unnamed protein product, partial [marine sediment metagenome]